MDCCLKDTYLIGYMCSLSFFCFFVFGIFVLLIFICIFILSPSLGVCVFVWKALGLVSAGTNNSRVAQLLRQLSEFYAREASHLFVTRIAQGLNHMGKVRAPAAAIAVVLYPNPYPYSYPYLTHTRIRTCTQYPRPYLCTRTHTYPHLFPHAYPYLHPVPAPTRHVCPNASYP